jgi:hypothetical protein
MPDFSFSNSILPEIGWINPAIAFRRLDFPEPFLPARIMGEFLEEAEKERRLNTGFLLYPTASSSIRIKAG